MAAITPDMNSARYYGQKIREDIAPRQFGVDETDETRAGTLGAGKTLRDAMREDVEAANTGPYGKDSVTISEEGRAKSDALAAEQKGGMDGAAIAGNAGGNKELDAAGQTRERILKQIKEVKEKLEKAQQKLDQLTAQKASSGTAKPSSDAAAQAAEAAGLAAEGMGQSTEIEAAQTEIDQLNQQLQTLYQELQNGQSSGSSTPAMGTAGIGGEGDGGGGKGERIAVG